MLQLAKQLYQVIRPALPYLLVALLLPGGFLMAATAWWLNRRHKHG